jgi:hypothetical protein
MGGFLLPVLPDERRRISRLSASWGEVMFNSAAQGGDIAVDTRIVKVIALVDTGSGALLGTVERGLDLGKLVEG